MKNQTKINTLFLDIGGVLLTNGWDHDARKRACSTFGLDEHDFESRHALTVDTLEIGKITLNEYLRRVLFYKEQKITLNDFIAFMYEQSKPYSNMLEFIADIKSRYGLRVVAVSNECRELNEYRIKKFSLDRLFDVFVSSSYVHLKKPDPEIYRFALDLSCSTPDQVAYIDDRLMYVQIGASLGLKAIQHTSLASTKAALNLL